MRVAFVLVVLDIVTGLVSALVNHNFKSAIMRAGGLKKCAELSILCGAAYIGRVAVEYTEYVHLVKYYIIIMECASIAENFGKLYPDNILTQKIKSILGGKENDVK